MIGVTISCCLSHFRDSLIVCAMKRSLIHILHWVWTSRHTRWCRGTLQTGVSGLNSSVRMRSVSLIRGSLVQDISIGHQQGPRWLCSAASSYTEAVTLLFYRAELLNSVVCTQSLEQFVDISKNIAATQQSVSLYQKKNFLWSIFFVT